MSATGSTPDPPLTADDLPEDPIKIITVEIEERDRSRDALWTTFGMLAVLLLSLLFWWVLSTWLGWPVVLAILGGSALTWIVLEWVNHSTR